MSSSSFSNIFTSTDDLIDILSFGVQDLPFIVIFSLFIQFLILDLEYSGS